MLSKNTYATLAIRSTRASDTQRAGKNTGSGHMHPGVSSENRFGLFWDSHVHSFLSLLVDEPQDCESCRAKDNGLELENTPTPHFTNRHGNYVAHVNGKPINLARFFESFM